MKTKANALLINKIALFGVGYAYVAVISRFHLDQSGNLNSPKRRQSLRLTIRHAEMNELIEKWNKENLINVVSSQDELHQFEINNNVKLTESLRDYFLIINGTSDYDDNFFHFYSISSVKSIFSVYGNYTGVPDFTNALKLFSRPDKQFVIADYMLNLICYHVDLSNVENGTPIYGVCGNEVKQICNDFDEFLRIYVSDFNQLIF